MAGLDPAIHEVAKQNDPYDFACGASSWIAGSSPAMTTDGLCPIRESRRMPQASLRIGKAELTAFVTDVFAAVGLNRDHAHEWAKMLVWANLRGTDSHGIIRIPRYIDLVNA